MPLDRLLRSKRPVTIQEIMNDEPDRVEATEHQEEVARLFERYNLVSAAVVDEAGRLVGVILVDDIVDVLEEEADADIKQLGGVKSDEELSDTVLYTQRSRFPWLFANMCTAFLAASVIRLFSESLERMVALAILMPIVASMGGNAGTQTMTVAVRALATRELGRANAWRIIRREAAVGLLNGLVFAVILGALAGLWFQSAAARHRHRPCPHHGPGLRGARRNLRAPDPQPARRRPGRLVGSLRHQHHGYRRLFRLFRYRNGLV